MIHTTGHSESKNIGNSEVETEAPTFPLESLPQPMRSFVADVAHVHQLPPELPGAMALATVSAALGQSVFLDNPPHRTPPNIYFLTFARSGTGKSECYRAVTWPLFDLQSELIRRFEETANGHEADRQILEADARALRANKGNKLSSAERRTQLEEILGRLKEVEKEATPPRLIAEDATGPALVAMLRAHDETLALFSSEASEVISNISGRHNATGRTDETLLLKSYSIEPHTQDRVGTGNQNLEQPCLAVLLITTPDEAAGLFDKECFTVGGLMPRFLICAPETRWQHKDGIERRLNPKWQEVWRELVQGLARVYRVRGGDPGTVRMEDAAAELLRFHWNGYADRQDEFMGQEAFAARHTEQAARLALILHAVKTGVDACKARLTEATVREAINLIEFYAGEQQKMLSKGVQAAREARLETLLSLLMNHPEGMTLRELKRSGWQEAEIRQLHDAFPERVSVVEVQNPKGGPRSTVVSAL